MPRFRSSSHPPAPSEPLFVLADLQEFGAPAQPGPLAPRSAQTDTTTTTTPSPTSSTFKRFSDLSVASALSFRDDTKLDYPRATTPVLPVRPSPSSSGRQSDMPALHRMGSFGPFLSPDISLGGETVSFHNLPIPRRRNVASPDAGSPPASRRNGRIFPPPSSFGNRPYSVMSSSTEQDWLALTAAMRSPRKPEVSPPMRGLDSFSDMFTGETAPRGMIREPLSSAPAAVPTRWSGRQPGSSSSARSPPFLSLGSPPQQAQSSQPFYRVSFVPSLDSPLSSATSSSGFHTPSFQRGSSSSSANISSPPVTPASASSSSAPRDAANPCSNAKLHGILEEPLFAEEPAIDYRRRRHASRSTDETETIRLEELLDKDKEDSPIVHTRLSPHPPRVELAFIREGGLPPLRSESLSPSGTWKSEWSTSPDDPGPSKPRVDPPPRNPRPGHRPPPLQLTSSGQAAPSESAPRAEGTLDAPSASRSQRRSAYALPAHSHLPVSVSSQKPQRSSVILIEDVLEDAQQFVGGRDTHSPFGRLRAQGSADSLSPCPHAHAHSHSRDPIHDPEEGSPYTPRTPEFAPPSEYSPKSLDFPRLSVDSPSPNDPAFSSPPHGQFTPSPSPSPSQRAELEAELEQDHGGAWPGMWKWRSQTPAPSSSSPGRLSPSPSPAQAPAPLSPVISVHSDHSVTGSIRSGITKLFGLGGGGRRSRSGSKSASGAVGAVGAGGPGAEPARSSDSFDWVPPPPPSTISTVSLGSLGTCASANSRAEERRLRKEAARARSERVAQELAEKARRRVEDGKARAVAYVREKNPRPWEEAGPMHQSLSYL